MPVLFESRTIQHRFGLFLAGAFFRMNIGIDIRPLAETARTGVGEYIYGLLSALFERDRDNQYILFCNSWKDGAAIPPDWKRENVRYAATKYPNKLFNASLCAFHRPRLDQIVKCQMSDVRCPDIFFSPNLNFTAVSPRTKFILTIHDLSFEFFPRLYTRKQRLWHRAVGPRRLVHRADVILTPSENTRRDVVEHYGAPEEKVKVAYPGITKQEAGSREIVRQKYGLSENFILFLGTLEPRKNILSIIDAYKQSCSLLPVPHSLVIAGALGWKCDDVFRAINSASGARYIGYVAPEDKTALYQLAQVFVYPSIYEGFGLPVLEAMSAGTPVIISNRSSLPEVVGDAGYLVNPLNIAEIAEGMHTLATDANLRSRLIARGRARAEQFSWDRAAKQFLELCA